MTVMLGFLSDRLIQSVILVFATNGPRQLALLEKDMRRDRQCDPQNKPALKWYPIVLGEAG
jgi:hypothetical protein